MTLEQTAEKVEAVEWNARCEAAVRDRQAQERRNAGRKEYIADRLGLSARALPAFEVETTIERLSETLNKANLWAELLVLTATGLQNHEAECALGAIETAQGHIRSIAKLDME